MLIKVNGEYLEFDGLIEVEKQIKLFEEISTTDGDFSYAFDLQKTLANTRILQNPFPDNINKPVYQKIPAIIYSDSGALLFDGYLRVQKVTTIYECSFFAGNNNWFGMLSGNLSELDFSEYDTDQTEAKVQAAIFNTSGVVFPVVDNGVLSLRGFYLMKLEDFVAAIYVKDVFNKIFSSHGIKIEGELLNDTNYQAAITINSNKSEQQITARTSYVHTDFSARPNDNTIYKTLFDDDSNFPYYDGSANNYDLINSKYVADVKMVVKVDLNLTMAFSGGSIVNFMYFYVNGVQVLTKNQTSYDLSNQAVSMSGSVTLEAGDELEIYTKWTDFVGPSNNNIVDGTLKITPTFVYKAFGNSIIPDWTQQRYVSAILRLFNVLTFYNVATKTLTFNIFEKIKSHEAIDLSEYISETEVDYTDFISSYGKTNLFSYNETTYDDIRVNFFRYAKGSLAIDNDFLEDQVDVLESDFSSPIGYINPTFDMSMEKLNLIEVEEDITVDITGVSDVLGHGRFAISDDVFFLSDMVRVSDSTNSGYNGDYMVSSLAAGYVELKGLDFDTDARAKITKLNFRYSDSDDVFILHQVPLYQVTKFSGNPSIYIENSPLGYVGLGFFNILNTGRQINRDFIYSLSFSGEDNPLHYQHTIIEQYFRLFGKVLNDPVKLFSIAHLPYALYNQIDFLSPIKIRTEESTNEYYLNRITGYKGSEYESTIELIKI